MGLLKDKINNDLKQAMKARQMEEVSALRLVVAAIKNQEIDLRGKGKLKPGEALADDDLLKLLGTIAKQRKESIQAFKDGNRLDLAQKEQKELDLISKYLPAQLSEADIEKAVEQVIKETGATGAKEMGLVMKQVMAKLAGQADGKLVNEMVRKKLS
ncbi:MAG: GatB/YqeY domain-containing protein [Pseudomonadota bacterium]